MDKDDIKIGAFIFIVLLLMLIAILVYFVIINPVGQGISDNLFGKQIIDKNNNCGYTILNNTTTYFGCGGFPSFISQWLLAIFIFAEFGLIYILIKIGRKIINRVKKIRIDKRKDNQ